MSFSFFGRAWAWIKIPVFVLLVLFVAFFVWSIYLGRDKVLTDQAVAKIHSTRLVASDVNGKLPPMPDAVANDATLAGVDSNNNGIRDDVEIAIYNAHKDNVKLALAQLQYAKELQMEFTDVFNSSTLVAVIQEESRGFGCIYDSVQAKDLKTLNSTADPLVKEVKSLVFDVQSRKDKQQSIYDKYMTSYSLLTGNDCDIDSKTFST